MDLITPASEVAEGLDGHAHVSLQSQSVNSSRVDRFDGGELLLVLLHQVSQPVGGKQRPHRVTLTSWIKCFYFTQEQRATNTNFALFKLPGHII